MIETWNISKLKHSTCWPLWWILLGTMSKGRNPPLTKGLSNCKIFSIFDTFDTVFSLKKIKLETYYPYFPKVRSFSFKISEAPLKNPVFRQSYRHLKKRPHEVADRTLRFDTFGKCRSMTFTMSFRYSELSGYRSLHRWRSFSAVAATHSQIAIAIFSFESNRAIPVHKSILLVVPSE